MLKHLLAIGAVIAILVAAPILVAQSNKSNQYEANQAEKLIVLEAKLIDLDSKIVQIDALSDEVASVQYSQAESDKLIQKLLADYSSLKQTLDSERARLTAFQAEVESTPVPDPVADFKPCNCDECCEALKKEVEQLKADYLALKQVVEGLKPKTVVTQSAAKPAAIVKSDNYQPRWKNHDGLSLHDHISQVHGFSGTPDEMERAHDAWHDANGGDAPKAAMAASPVQSKVVTRSRSVQTQNCPNGRCPTTPQPRLFRGWFR